MRIGILGSGLMGGKLGTIFARAGHEVVFSYARSNDKLKRLARNTQGNARAGTPGEAAKEADALLLAVHWTRVDDVLKQAGDLSDKVIVTCSLPMDVGNTKLIMGTTTSGAEELAKKVPQAHVVAAFQTVPSEVLFGVYETRRKATRPSLVYCGDDQSAKDVAAKLIDDAAFDPVDAGPLRIARYSEPFALLVAHLAYEGEGGRNWLTGSSGSGNEHIQIMFEGVMRMSNEPSAAKKMIGDFSPKLVELTDRVLFGDVWERPELSKRDRSLVTVAALIALNRTAQLQFHLKKALQNGLKQGELIEVITHLAFYSGWPNAMSAIMIAKEVFSKA